VALNLSYLLLRYIYLAYQSNFFSNSSAVADKLGDARTAEHYLTSLLADKILVRYMTKFAIANDTRFSGIRSQFSEVPTRTVPVNRSQLPYRHTVRQLCRSRAGKPVSVGKSIDVIVS